MSKVAEALDNILILKEKLQDPYLFGSCIFPHYFRLPGSTFHKRIISEAVKHNRLGIAAPRESAKSSILGFLYPIWCIAYQKKRFIIFLMNTEEKAKGALGGIKREIKENELLKIYDISILKDTETDTVFKVGDFEVRVLCKGASQMGSIRGERFGAYRPDLVIGDDIEDDEMVRNPDRRRQVQEDFDDAVEPAVDRHEGQIIVIGTVLHDDSLVRKITSPDFYPEYYKLFYRALDTKTGKSLWKSKWSIEDLKKIEANNPEKFAKEYQNDPVSGSRRSFQREDFRRWTVEDNCAVLYNREGGVQAKYNLSDCKAGIGCDLAWESKRQNDFTAIMPGFLTPNDEILIDDYVNKKGMKPDEFENIIFPMVSKYEKLTGSVCPIAFEKAKHEKIMKWLLGKAMKVRGKYLIIKDLAWETDKITRIITTLQPRYVNHTIFHRSGMGDLEYQLMRLPDGTHDDLCDSEQGLVRILSNPKKERKDEKKDDMFDWLLKQQRDKKERKDFIFGNKKVSDFPFKTTITYK